MAGDCVKSLGADTPIVVFAHIPLLSVYPESGWGTTDSERALGYLKRFGSVTVLNGHIHQVLQKGRRQCDLSHCDVYCIPTASTWSCAVAWSVECVGRKTPQHA